MRMLFGALAALCFAAMSVAALEKIGARYGASTSSRWRVMRLGALSVVLALVVEVIWAPPKGSGPWGALGTGFIAGLVEESAKALAFYLAVWRGAGRPGRATALFDAARVGVTFGLVEYLCRLGGVESIGGFFGVLLFRPLTAVVGHAMDTAFIGYWAARERYDGVGPGFAGGVSIAVTLHALWDIAAFLGVEEAEAHEYLWLLAMVLVLFALYFGMLRRLRQHASEAARLDMLDAEAKPVTSPVWG